jgi:hypothetical protein
MTTVLLALHTPHNENLFKEFTRIRNQIERLVFYSVDHFATWCFQTFTVWNGL